MEASSSCLVYNASIAIQPKDQRVWWRADGKILPESVSNPNNLSVGNERANGRQAFLRFKTRQHDASMNVRIAGRQEWSSSACPFASAGRRARAV